MSSMVDEDLVLVFTEYVQYYSEAFLVRPPPSSGPSSMTNYTTLLVNMLKLLKSLPWQGELLLVASSCMYRY
jgi:hypothetical protein